MAPKRLPRRRSSESPAPKKARTSEDDRCDKGEASSSSTAGRKFDTRAALYEVELDAGWTRFDAETTAKIAEVVAEGGSSFQWRRRGTEYLIDLATLEQINMKTGVTRRLRKYAGAGASTSIPVFGKGLADIGLAFGKGFGKDLPEMGLAAIGKSFGKGLAGMPLAAIGKSFGKGASTSPSDSSSCDDEDVPYEIELDIGWRSFDARTARNMKRAQEEGLSSMTYQARGHKYEVDFKAMTQTNVRTRVRRRIRIVPIEEEEVAGLDEVPGLRRLHDLLKEAPPSPQKPSTEIVRMTPNEVRETIISYVPEASGWIAPRSDNTPALDFLVSSYENGFPALPAAVSKHLAEGMQAILAALKDPKSAGLTHSRAKHLATQVAETFTNCQAVQARVIDSVQAEIRGVSSHSLPAQLRSLVEEQRELALDRTVCHYHPKAHVTDDGNPAEQLPHLSNMYRRHLGQRCGFGGPRLEGAKSDRHAQRPLPASKAQVLRKFWSEFTARDIVSMVVSDVNQPSADVQRRISLELLMKWAGKELSNPHQIFYDEESTEKYGDLSPSPDQLDGKQPVLHKSLAVELLLSNLEPKKDEDEVAAPGV